MKTRNYVRSHLIIRLWLALLACLGLGLASNLFSTPAAAKTAMFACNYNAAPLTKTVQAAANTFQVSVTASASFPDIVCPWTAQANDNWLQVTPAAGVASTNVTVIVSANSGPQRTGHVTVAGKSITITQSSGCTFTAQPNNFDFAASGGSGVVTMTPNTASCTFSASKLVSWIHINSQANGKLNFTVDPNPGPARDGIISVASNTISIHQQSGCDYTLTPTNKDVTASGGLFAFEVKASSNMCQWQPVSNAAWLQVNNAGPYKGDGLIGYTVAANTGFTRSATITVGADKLTVTQANGCNYSINQNSQSFSANGGNGTVNVTASGSDCPWTASSNDNWIIINGGLAPKYLGNGSVSFTVAPNNGPARTGTINVAGKNFIVGQSAGCSFTINPATQNFSAAGGEGTVAVTASNAACPYFINNPPAWVIVTSGANGTGNGTVKYSVAANNGPARSGTMEVAGKTLTITQDAASGPAPTIASLNPGFTAKGGKEFILKVTGANFSDSCRVRWNGQERPTSFVNNTQLLATIPAEDIAAEGPAMVSVFNFNSNAGSGEKLFMIYGALANVSAASFDGETLAPASIVAAFGSELATQVQVANKQPLPIDLAGTGVTIQDALGKVHQAPLFFVSPNQINYLMPEQVAHGPALVMVQSGNKHISIQFVQISPIAPALFTANASGKGLATGVVLRVKANGQQVYEAFAHYDAATAKFIANPIDLSDPSEQVYLIFFGTGFRFRSSLDAVAMEIGGMALKPDYAGGVASLAGLDQLNLLAPHSLAGRGEVEVGLKVDGKTANVVKLTFK